MSRQKIIKFHAKWGKSYDIIDQIMAGFSARLDYLTEKHAQVSVSHMTIQIPIQAETTAAQTIGASVTLLRRKLKGMGAESQAGWVREIKNNKEHFHLGIIWNSEKFQNAYELGQMLNEIIHTELNLNNNDKFVNVNPPCYPNYQQDLNLRSNYTIKIRRNQAGFENQKANIIDWLSYLAKTETKGVHDGKYIREFGFSLFRKEH